MPPDVPDRPADIEIEWNSIQYHYEIGKLNIREIALRYGVAPTTLHHRARRLGWQRGARNALARPRSDRARKQRVLSRHRRDIAALLALLDKLRGGLARVVEGKAEERDDRLLTKTGGAIEAFYVLANSQAKLVQLHRQAFGLDAIPAEDPRQFVENLRAAQREMEAVTRGLPDLPMDGAEAAPDAAGVSR
jgi:transposase-like protein